MALRLSPSEQMNEGNRNLLISNMGFLQENLQLSTLLPYMTPVLNDEDFAAIRNLTTTREQVEMLVTILPERGDKAFHCFIQNLRISQPHLADYMCKNPHFGETMFPRGQFSSFQKSEQSKQQSEWAREQSEQLKEREGEQFKQLSEREREQSKQPCEPLGETKQPSEREPGQSKQPKEREGEQFEQSSEPRGESRQPSKRERGQSKQPNEPRGQSKQPSEPRGESRKPSERDRGQSKQPSERDREQSKQPSEREREQSKQPNELRGQSKQPSERERGQSKQPSEREQEQSKQPNEQRGQSKQPSERERGQSKQPSEREREQSKQANEPRRQSTQASEQEREQSKQPDEPRGKSKQPSEREREQSKQPNEPGGQSKQPSEQEREQSKQPSERDRGQSKRPSEQQGEQLEQLSERERQLPKQPTERQGEQSEQRSEREGVPALHPKEKASNRMIFADLVTEKGSSWILKESGICIKFSPNAVQTPVIVTSSLWRPGTASPPLEDGETLVSNIIELACDDPVAIQFSKVTVTLSHSATELRGYELVLKEQIDSKKNTWKDLETSCPLDPLGENYTSKSGLRFAQAKITSFSMYAVISRLKSYKFLVTKESPEFTCTVTEYPDVSVTVPTKYLPAVQDSTFTLKIQPTSNDDYEDKGAFVSPILHISCPVEVALEEPAFIRMPFTLKEEQIDLQNLSSGQIRVFRRSTRRKSQEWREITRNFKTPPKLENGVVSFQVKHFSKFVVIAQLNAGFLSDIRSPISTRSAPQHAGFLAYLCDAEDPEQYKLILCCSPRHLISEVRRDVSSAYTVILQGDSTSTSPLNKADRATFHLPDTFTLIKEENTFLTFRGNNTCRKTFPVLVKSTEGIQSISFFKFNKGREEEEPLCTVQIDIPGLPASKPLTSGGEPLSIAEHSKLWKTDPTLKLLLPLKEALGTCWKCLGIALDLSNYELHNIQEDYNFNTDKAFAVIECWSQREGTSATMGHLALALGEIERKDIAHKLIELLDKKEKKENEAHHAQCQENKDQPRGESSSSRMKELDKKEKKAEYEAHLTQWQENNDQPRGESSSSIMSKTRIYFRGKVIEKDKETLRVPLFFSRTTKMLETLYVRYTLTGTIHQRELTTRAIRIDWSS